MWQLLQETSFRQVTIIFKSQRPLPTRENISESPDISYVQGRGEKRSGTAELKSEHDQPYTTCYEVTLFTSKIQEFRNRSNTAA